MSVRSLDLVLTPLATVAIFGAVAGLKRCETVAEKISIAHVHGWDVVEQMELPVFVTSAKKAEEVNKALKIVQARRKTSKDAGPKKFARFDRPVGLHQPNHLQQHARFGAPLSGHMSHVGGRSSFRNPNFASNVPATKFTPYDTCKLCGKQGHWVKDCPMNRPVGPPS